MKLTIVEAIKKAVREHNAYLAGQIADKLRDKYGMNYKETYEFAHKHTDVSPAAWETLMYECDTDNT